MLFLKLLQRLVKSLNSQGTPGQVAARLALGTGFGLTPIASVHNLLLFALALIINVSLAGVFLGWSLAVPLGFALDPVFDPLGAQLLGAPSLGPLWTRLYNAPGVPLTNFIPPVREGARRLGLINLEQIVAALVEAVEHPAQGIRVMTVDDIRAMEAGPAEA